MEYRRLGQTGIKTSVLSYGSWVTYHTQADLDTAASCMKTAYDCGVNFFDNAESYALGKSEEIMGAALKKLGWRRSSYLVSTKIFFGLNDGVNEKNTLSRKRLLEGIDGSLERLRLDHVDMLFCHRPDPDTTIEEVVWAMSDIVASGRAVYWGTSEWSALQIMEAWSIADKRNLRKPQMEQPQYNLFTRDRVENEYAGLYDSIGLGLTTWSPLASGILSGKYNEGIPPGTRLALKGYEWLRDSVINPERIDAVKRLIPVANDLGASLSQLSIAWTARNRNVSTVITGASRSEQVLDNMKALDLIAKIDDDVAKRIEEAIAGVE